MDSRQLGLQVTLALNLSSDETPGQGEELRPHADFACIYAV